MRIFTIIVGLFLIGCSVKEVKNMNLEQMWILQKMQSKTLQVKKGMNIKFNLKESSFYGNDGCNNIFGQVEISKEKLAFKNINSTLMACEDMEVSNKFVNLLEKTVSYKVSEDRLYFYDKDKNILLEFMSK